MTGKLCLAQFLLVAILLGHSPVTVSANPSSVQKIPGSLLIPENNPNITFGKPAIPRKLCKRGREDEEDGCTILYGPCRVHIRELPELQPVYINNFHELRVPTDGYFGWSPGMSSWIACAGLAMRITCIEGYIFDTDYGPSDIRQIQCTRKVTGNQQSRVDPQSVRTYKAIGFNVRFPDGDRFIDLFYSSIDVRQGSVLYTHHIIYGNELRHKYVSGIDPPSFKSDGFPKFPIVFHPRSAYSQDNVRNILNSYPFPIEHPYTERFQLQKGHLTPNADQLFTPWQWSTYFFINVAGMWNTINNGNWKKVENSVRSLAIARNGREEHLDIFTGTYGTSKLCVGCPDFTLENGRIPVPEYVWKIVKDPIENEAIALVISNNPFMRVPRLCGSSWFHEFYGWYQDQFDNITLGEVIVCTVQELKNVVGYIPSAAEANYILHHNQMTDF